MFTTIQKRDGRKVPYDITKIEKAVAKAMEAVGRHGTDAASAVAGEVERRLLEIYGDQAPDVESIQDMVE